MLTFVVAFWLEGLWRTRLLPILIGVFILSAAVILPHPTGHASFVATPDIILFHRCVIYLTKYETIYFRYELTYELTCHSSYELGFVVFDKPFHRASRPNKTVKQCGRMLR